MTRTKPKPMTGFGADSNDVQGATLFNIIFLEILYELPLPQ